MLDFNQTETFVVQHEYALSRPYPYLKGSSRNAPYVRKYEQGEEVIVLKHIEITDESGLVWRRLPTDIETWIAIGYPVQQVIFLTSLENYVSVTE